MDRNEDSIQNHFCGFTETACSFFPIPSLLFIFTILQREKRAEWGKK